MIIYRTWCEKLKPPGKANLKGRRKQKRWSNYPTIHSFLWGDIAHLRHLPAALAPQQAAEVVESVSIPHTQGYQNNSCALDSETWFIPETPFSRKVVWNMNLNSCRHLRGFLPAYLTNTHMGIGINQPQNKMEFCPQKCIVNFRGRMAQVS